MGVICIPKIIISTPHGPHVKVSIISVRIDVLIFLDQDVVLCYVDIKLWKIRAPNFPPWECVQDMGMLFKNSEPLSISAVETIDAGKAQLSL